jgi:hypothetical protein
MQTTVAGQSDRAGRLFGKECHSERVGQPIHNTASVQRHLHLHTPQVQCR